MPKNTVPQLLSFRPGEAMLITKSLVLQRHYLFENKIQDDQLNIKTQRTCADVANVKLACKIRCFLLPPDGVEGIDL